MKQASTPSLRALLLGLMAIGLLLGCRPAPKNETPPVPLVKETPPVPPAEPPQPSPNSSKFKEIPRDVIAAYAKLGGDYRWVDVTQEYYGWKTEGIPTEKDLPGFYFYTFSEEQVRSLPPVPVPFALFPSSLSEKDAVTDTRLKLFQGLTNLAWLDLWDAKVTDAGLKELKGLKNLRRLDLRKTQVTDAGLKELQELTNLTTLILASTQVTGGGAEGTARTPQPDDARPQFRPGDRHRATGTLRAHQSYLA